MKVLVTGSNGFIGKNLIVSLNECNEIEVLTFSHQAGLTDLAELIAEADFIFHLAGVNRPENENEFEIGNAEFTSILCDLIKEQNRNIPVVYTSSIQVEQDNLYGQSKQKAESHLIRLHDDTQNDVYIYRLPNVFGKWCQPNNNSVVATFCYNIVNNLPIIIHDPKTELNLVHIGAVVTSFLAVLFSPRKNQMYIQIDPVYKITLGELAEKLMSYKRSRETLMTEEVGCGFDRVLYATYISYTSPSNFSYSLAKHEDHRGVFVEMLKTRKSGQLSFFTAHPGITRGGHYHHCKTEKFLVIKGKARFKFRHIITGETSELISSGDEPEIVETIPGWSHDITNIGDDELIVMLWANENYNPNKPDTVSYEV
ncbi:MAG: NAD-dependent epimerase/dehydratase family protein [Gammaproteobacteria bacterium]